MSIIKKKIFNKNKPRLRKKLHNKNNKKNEKKYIIPVLPSVVQLMYYESSN